MQNSMQTLQVAIEHGEYDIHIGRALNKSALLQPFIENKQVLIVSNTTIAPLYMDSMLADCAAASTVAQAILADGECHKTLETMQQIYDVLMQHNFNRDCVIIALGGGVVGDMAGFAAASFQRGVDFIQIPTTLLSQVDSSVGGKTGVNHALGKNMIGAFKQPKLVLIETDTLKTLPKREVSAGIAEVIKYALINDADFLTWLQTNMVSLLALKDDVVAEAIYRSCQHKATIVAEDEFEAGRRALLNLGHTFGHAIENHMGYGEWLHGEAVAVGMLQAAYLSAQLGWITDTDVLTLRQLLEEANLPVQPPEMPVDTALELMSRDKKVKSGKIRLVLLKQLGQAIITDDFEYDALKRTLEVKSLA